MIEEQIKELADVSAELSKKSDELRLAAWFHPGRRWALAVRNGPGGDEVMPLLGASRLVRLEAMGELHAVIVGMCQRASEFLSQIQAAKDLVFGPKGVPSP